MTSRYGVEEIGCFFSHLSCLLSCPTHLAYFVYIYIYIHTIYVSGKTFLNSVLAPRSHTPIQ